jgi:hypothetical protein
MAHSLVRRIDSEGNALDSVAGVLGVENPDPPFQREP